MAKSKLQNLISNLGIDESGTKPIKKAKQFHTVKQNIPLSANYNMQADILYLPETKEGYKYLLVIDDLAVDSFDCEPLKTKSSTETLKAMQTIFKRKYLDKPYASLQTDNGTEFKLLFDKWLYDNSIIHKLTIPYRHSQNGNIENLNKLLGRILNGYLNKIEKETGNPYREWTDILDQVVEKLNKLRLKPERDPYTMKYDVPNMHYPNLFNVGDIVHYKLDYPEDALGNKQPTATFRVADQRWSQQARKIKFITYYAGGQTPYRYLLENVPNVSYPEHELKLADNQKSTSTYIIKAIIDKKNCGQTNILFGMVGKIFEKKRYMGAKVAINQRWCCSIAR